jgi:rhodanese-related sulfurtransferase
MTETGTSLPLKDYHQVRASLLAREEIALLDVREEAPHAEGHPLFAANLPLSRLELVAYTKLPRRDVPIVTIDRGEGLAELAAQRLKAMGYTDVAVFKGGIAAWTAAGGELFIDVNVPSKAFGELLESVCHTPSLPAEEVQALINSGEDCLVVDARRFDEYQTMTIPGSISVPGAELALRVPGMVSNANTQIIVHCAGRTRSLVGTQSLINFGLPNKVHALRNGTIGWTLARQKLALGQSRRYPENAEPEALVASAEKARNVADHAGVKRATRDDIRRWSTQDGRTTYFFDVRSPEEYEKGHLPGFLSIPGGQLVQELEMYAPVRGARIVVSDTDGVRANMTASWLAQMAWDVYVADGIDAADLTEAGTPRIQLPPVPPSKTVSAADLGAWLAEGNTVVVDLTRHAVFRKGHIPGAWFLIRSLLLESMPNLPKAQRTVVTCPDGILSRFVAPELAGKVKADVYVLDGGTAAWTAAGHQLEAGEARLASPPIDRYRRPYEGTEVPDSAMQAYLDWEFGLVAQLERDGTHHFKPMQPSH